MGDNDQDPTNEPSADAGWLTRQTPEVQAAIRGLRSENANWRTRYKEAEAKLSQGGNADVTAKLAAAGTTIKDLKVTVALTELAHEANIKPKIAKAILADEGAWGDLDPDAEDFREVLADRLNDLAGRLPELKTMQITATRSGGDNFNGQTDTQLGYGDLKNMSPDQVAAAVKSGGFNRLLGRRA